MGDKMTTAGSPYRIPVASLMIMTLALNVMSLSLPLAAQLIFNRILPAPGTSTLPLVVGGVVVIGLLEALTRMMRTYVLLDAHRVVTANMTTQVLTTIVRSRFNPGARGSARTLDYFTRIGQVAEKESGRILVGMAELIFLPIILTLIFIIAPVMGVLVLICLGVGFAITFRGATSLRRQSSLLNRLVERRYRFLLSILTAIHPLKALGVEDFMLRRYEAIQAGIAKTSIKTAQASSRLLNGASITNQAIMISTLVYGAYAINQGLMTLGSISAVVLLGGRLMAPLQRAIFIFIQARDLCEAEETVADVLAHPLVRTSTVAVAAEKRGEIRLAGVAARWGLKDSPERLDDVNLEIRSGETVIISSTSENASTRLLQIIAGIHPPSDGSVVLDGVPIADFPLDQLNRSVAYVSGAGVMFKGTIRDNITRFGEVALEDAMSIGALMGLQAQINELPRGLETPLNGGLSDNIPTGLCQQLAILRALAFRPRLILLDHVDRGLDRQNYARLQRFIASVQGQASLVIASEDRNLTAGAQRRFVLRGTRLEPDHDIVAHELTTYRSLKL